MSDGAAPRKGATATLACVPAGNPSGPEPADNNVRDQVMRTLSAVRTRLRGTNPDTDDADTDHGEHNGNGDRAMTAPPEPQPPSPMDPLLADPPVNGHGTETLTEPPTAETFAAGMASASVIDAPPLVEEPITQPAEPVPADEDGPPDPGGRSGRSSGPRRPRVRPALPLLRRRPRVRKVTRIVRRVDAWGVFKISIIFYVILYIILLVAGILLWNLANTTGTVANVEGFLRDLFGLKTFEFDGEKLFRASWVLGAILVVAGTGLNVTLAVLFNLISDLVGGVRVTVLEEEVILRERPVIPRGDGPLDDVPPADPAAELAPPGFPLPPPDATEVVDGGAPAATSVEPPQNAGL